MNHGQTPLSLIWTTNIRRFQELWNLEYWSLQLETLRVD